MQNRARTKKEVKAATVCRFAIVPLWMIMHFKFHSKSAVLLSPEISLRWHSSLIRAHV